ncbi:MAG: hypothetical protein ACE5DI_00950 [Candidatus Micrarchaeia archaeon]
MARSKKTSNRKKQEKAVEASFLSQYAHYLALVTFLALYLFFSNTALQLLFGVLVFLSLVFVLVKELSPSDWSKSGLLEFARETGTAFVAALVFWFLISFLLYTSKPLDVVTSCSMRPVLDRGDMIVIQGGSVKAQVVEVQNESKPFVPLRRVCTRTFNDGSNVSLLCTAGLEIEGNEYLFDKSNDVIVFDSNSVGGLVVHRVALAITTVDGKTRFLTKGDNNPSLDQEARFFPAVEEESVHGRLLFRIPLIGYLKLLLFGQFQTPPGCESAQTNL